VAGAPVQGGGGDGGGKEGGRERVERQGGGHAVAGAPVREEAETEEVRREGERE
jgi:hypothetical protein